jgi:hypothetical protein
VNCRFPLLTLSIPGILDVMFTILVLKIFAHWFPHYPISPINLALLSNQRSGGTTSSEQDLPYSRPTIPWEGSSCVRAWAPGAGERCWRYILHWTTCSSALWISLLIRQILIQYIDKAELQLDMNQSRLFYQNAWITRSVQSGHSISEPLYPFNTLKPRD